jgi:hypothetical protein
MSALVVVPVASMSRLTAAGISAALSLGDEVVAVTVAFTDPEETAADVSFRARWEEWHPQAPLPPRAIRAPSQRFRRSLRSRRLPAERVMS